MDFRRPWPRFSLQAAGFPQAHRESCSAAQWMLVKQMTRTRWLQPGPNCRWPERRYWSRPSVLGRPSPAARPAILPAALADIVERSRPRVWRPPEAAGIYPKALERTCSAWETGRASPASPSRRWIQDEAGGRSTLPGPFASPSRCRRGGDHNPNDSERARWLRLRSDRSAAIPSGFAELASRSAADDWRPCLRLRLNRGSRK